MTKARTASRNKKAAVPAQVPKAARAGLGIGPGISPGRGGTKTSRSPAKWQVVENVIAALEQVRATVPGTTVAQKVHLPCLAAPSETREIDVVVTIPASERDMRIGVDVKNEGRPLSSEALGTLIEKRDEVGLTMYCVVSTSGFSAAATTKAARRGVELMRLEEFIVSEFWPAVPGHHLVQTSIKHVEFQFVFDENALRSLEHAGLKSVISTAGHDRLHVHDNGGSVTLRQMINGQILKEAQRALPETPVEIEATVPITIVTDNCTKLSVGEKSLPAPERIDTVVHIARTVEPLRERRFRLGSLEISTVTATAGGELKQLGIVRVPRPTGETQLVFTHGPARPTARRTT